MTQLNLAVTLQRQGARTPGRAGATLLAQSLAAYGAALEVFRREEQPVQWAMTRENLANAEEAIAEHAATDAPQAHLRAALEHVEAALEIYDPQTMAFLHRAATDLRDRLRARLAP